MWWKEFVVWVLQKRLDYKEKEHKDPTLIHTTTEAKAGFQICKSVQ